MNYFQIIFKLNIIISIFTSFFSISQLILSILKLIYTILYFLSSMYTNKWHFNNNINNNINYKYNFILFYFNILDQHLTNIKMVNDFHVSLLINILITKTFYLNFFKQLKLIIKEYSYNIFLDITILHVIDLRRELNLILFATLTFNQLLLAYSYQDHLLIKRIIMLFA